MPRFFASMRLSMKIRTHLSLTVLLVTATTMLGADWPQWRGPDRTDVSKETGLWKKWPEEGPKRVWLYKEAGLGYAGPAIVGGKFFTMGTRDNEEVLLALDANTGKELWVAKLGRILENNWGNGPRGTPTVDGDHVFTLSGEGNLVCAQIADGKILWTTAMKDVGGKIPGWGYTESVVVDGDQVVCTPGGDQGTIAAFNKADGKVRWQSKDIKDKAQYASIIPATINGEKQYVQLTMESVFAVSPKDGALLWRVDFPGKTAVIPTPIVKDNLVFVTAGYGVGCKLIEIKPGNQAAEVYANKVLKNHHGGVVLVGDHLYGHSDGVGWVCMEFKTGNQVWAERSKLGKGAVSCADGMLYCLDEGSGAVALVEASPKGWSEQSRFKLDPQTTIRSPQGHIWTHPVIANGKLYLRDQDLIYCYDVKQ
jgi:outer membrane protein assembly factor BamB